MAEDKRVTESSLIGQQGVNLIEKVVLGMGYTWHPTGSLEAGIDGIIEIRDPRSGVVTNAVIQVQSKATEREWSRETDESFEYICDERDLRYWMKGNAPVILVVSRPSKGEAYWVSIKEYFRDLTRLNARSVHFEKRTQRFEVSSRDQLEKLALPVDSGVYLAPLPKNERLSSNLLSVTITAPTLFEATANVTSPKVIWDRLRELGGPTRGDWLLKSKKLYSFHDLSKLPWSKLCDVKTLKQSSPKDWSASEDQDKRRDFVHLLNRCLQEKLWHQEILFNQELGLYYFRPTPDRSPRVVKYRSFAVETPRTVFQGYPSKIDPKRIVYYRHSAFEAVFQQHQGKWFLQITPTYHYTRDGYLLYRYYEDELKGIKLLEKNASILGQLMMWADYVSRAGDMFTPGYPYLSFGQLLTVDVPEGFNDKSWLGDEEPEEAVRVKSTLDDLPLFSDERNSN